MSNQTVNYHLLKGELVLNFGGKTFNFPRSHAMFDQLLGMIRSGRASEIPNMIDFSTMVRAADPSLEFEIVDGVAFSGGKPVEKFIAQRLIELASEGFPVFPLLRFWKKAEKNPSQASREALYHFVEVNKFPLTEDGNFIAYKKVRKDFKDLYTGKMDNSIGKEVSISRSAVDADRGVTCSYGLHVAAFDYAQNSYGSSQDILLEVEVDPADVVTVPRDYNSKKCRLCRYKVLGLSVGGEIQDPIVKKDELKQYYTVLNTYLAEDTEGNIVLTPEQKAAIDKALGVGKIKDVTTRKKEVSDRQPEKSVDEATIGPKNYSVIPISKTEFDSILKGSKFKSIGEYDRAGYFKNHQPKPDKVYRGKLGDNLIFLMSFDKKARGSNESYFKLIVKNS